MAVVITVDDDAPPVVRGVYATLKRAAAVPRLESRMRLLRGVVSLRSAADSQTATARFDRGRVRVSSGVAPDADVVVTLDFANMSGPQAPKPKVKGAARHPLFALGVAQVLEPPAGRWQEQAAAFWAFASRDDPRMPRSVLVTCTDDGSSLRLGDDGPPDYVVEGTADALASTFAGQTIIGEDFLAGRIRVAGSFEHSSVITGHSIAWALGEGR